MIKNIVWRFLERISTQLISLLSSIVLLRLLEPSYFGTISIMLVFIIISELFVCEGLSTALIQKKDADMLDYSTVLIANLAISFILYAFLFCFSPLISKLFGNGSTDFVFIFRMLSIRIFFYAVHSVQLAYIAKKMLFQKLFYVSLFSTVISMILTVIIAAKYKNIYSLVFQNLSYIIFMTVILMFSIKERPEIAFSRERFNSLYRFGSKVLQTALLIQSFEQIQSLIIGKHYSDKELAFFDKGKRFPYLIASNTNSSIVSVLFPKMASIQNDREKMKELTRQYLRYQSFFICPILLGLAAVAEPFVHIFLTDKWLPCVPLLQAFCLTYLFYPLHSSNNQATKAMGRSDIGFRVELIKKVITLIIFVFCINHSIQAVAYGMVFSSAIGCFFDGYPNISLFDYSFTEQISDFSKSFLISLVMSVSVYSLSYLPIKGITGFLIQIISGIMIYLFLSVITKNEEFRFIYANIKNYITKIRSNL